MMESWDKFEPDFASLQMHDAGAKRVEHIRTRCLAALEAQRNRDLKRRPISDAWRRWLEPALAIGASALYLAAAVNSSLHLLLSYFR